MEKETLIITISQDFKRIFSQEIRFTKGCTIGLTEVPPGIVMGDYRHMQIDIKRKEVEKPWTKK